MKTLRIILVLLGLFILGILAYMMYLGAFKTIKVEIKEGGGEVLVYEEMIGDYSKSAKVMDRIYEDLLNKEKIETYKGFGIYFDNPQVVDKENLRSELGCILEEKDYDRIEDLANRFNIKTFPVDNYLTAEMPYYGKMSVFIGIFKVYPAFEKFAIDNNIGDEGEVMEIYDIPKKKIIYRKVFSRA